MPLYGVDVLGDVLQVAPTLPVADAAHLERAYAELCG
jgi:hypothetical protein